MQASLRNKLDELLERHEDIAHTLADPGIAADPERFRKLAREYAQLEELAGDYRCWRELGQEIASLEELAAGDEPDLAAIAEEELPACQQRLGDLEHQLRRHLIPKDRRDQANVYLEVRAGTGGDEAALFAGDLLRMYLHYAQTRGWRVDMISTSDGEHGGYKSVVALISGQGVYSRLKFESGAHRVQRVPETESQGRIHTSACTVAVLPEL
ncbi:MAG: PCRF domain-containing protein, partial [Salinisphaera sp.]|nr:PCRF domain-containing protein [Salinisphaera sp.]